MRQGAYNVAEGGKRGENRSNVHAEMRKSEHNRYKKNKKKS